MKVKELIKMLEGHRNKRIEIIFERNDTAVKHTGVIMLWQVKNNTILLEPIVSKSQAMN